LQVKSIPDAFTVFPVPHVRGGVLQFSINNTRLGYHAIRIYNSMGQEVYRKDMNVQGTFINDRITLPYNMAPGIYTIRLNNNSGTIDSRMIMIN
jgi:hypothetical protein